MCIHHSPYVAASTTPFPPRRRRRRRRPPVPSPVPVPLIPRGLSPDAADVGSVSTATIEAWAGDTLAVAAFFDCCALLRFNRHTTPENSYRLPRKVNQCTPIRRIGRRGSYALVRRVGIITATTPAPASSTSPHTRFRLHRLGGFGCTGYILPVHAVSSPTRHKTNQTYVFAPG